MKIVEIRELSQGELEVKIASIEKDLFKLRFQHGIRQLENTSRLSMLKRDIAKLKTIIRQMNKCS
jgi:large subunit ribosomal protein L29